MAIAAAALVAGCAETVQLAAQSPSGGGSGKRMFWPPPEPTRAIACAHEDDTLGAAADRVERALREAGFVDLRWHSVGTFWQHGFLVTTRLERGGAVAEQRWSPEYGQPSTLLWLRAARAPRLPAAGRFRAFVVAFGDLPLAHVAGRREPWDESTWLVEVGDTRPDDFPATRRARPADRMMALEYDYGAARAAREAPASAWWSRLCRP